MHLETQLSMLQDNMYRHDKWTSTVIYMALPQIAWIIPSKLILISQRINTLSHAW